MAMRDTSTPYILQAPADIAQEYGGNKRAIAQAARNGVIDPTAAVLAGMFIDKMRGAAAMEQASDQTVADQTFAPPQPQMAQAPAGLGRTPEAQVLASAMPAPGAPPPIRTPEPQVPMQAADGGLMALDVPDSMYDYAGGGIVAFASAGDTGSSKERNELLRQVAVKYKDNSGVLQALGKMSVDDLRKLMAFDAEAGPAPTVASPVQSPVAAAVVEPAASVKTGPFADVGEIPAPPPAQIVEPAASTTTGPFADVGEVPMVAAPVAAEVPGQAGGSGFRLPGQGAPNLGETLFATPDAAIQTGATVPENVPKGLAKYVDEYRALMPPESEDIKALREYYKGAPERQQKQKMEDIWTAVTMGGLGALAESKPSTGSTIKDILGTVGVAGKYAMPQITEGLKSRRAGEEAAMKARAELAKMDRAEQIEAIKGGMGLYGKELDREAQLEAAKIASGKGTDMSRYAELKLAASKGDKDAALKVEAIDRYLALYGASGIRGQAAAVQADVAQTKAATDIPDRARDNVDARLSKNYNSPENRTIRDLQKQDRKANQESKAKPGDPNYSNKALEYKEGLYQSEESRIRGGEKPKAQPKAETKPAAAPQAAPQGKFQVTAPNGKVYSFPTKEQADAFAKSFGSK